MRAVWVAIGIPSFLMCGGIAREALRAWGKADTRKAAFLYGTVCVVSMLAALSVLHSMLG